MQARGKIHEQQTKAELGQGCKSTSKRAASVGQETGWHILVHPASLLCSIKESKKNSAEKVLTRLVSFTRKGRLHESHRIF